MPIYWILVADSSRARLFVSPSPTGELTELRELAHPQGRAKRRDLVTSKPGRHADASGPHRSAMAQPDPKAHEADVFARQLVDVLEVGRHEHAYDFVYVCAPPGLLGRMRELYSTPLAKLVKDERDKNVVAMRPDEIREQLPAIL